MNASGLADASYGVRQFVVGTGGASFAGFGTPWPTSEARNNDTTGVIKFTLHQTTYDWEFIPTAGLPFTDSGTGTVHGPPPDTNAPTVTVVSAVPAALGPSDLKTDLTWQASENGAYSIRVDGTSCATGIQVATGSYIAPGNVTTPIDASQLAEGANTIRVCVTDAGTNTGNATASVSKNATAAANALHFDGAGDSVSFGQATNSLGATQFTLETWLRRTGAGVATSTGSGGVTDAIPLVTKGRSENDTPANVNMNYFLGIDASSGVLVADFEDDAGGENHPVSGTTQINADGSWHHAAVAYDGSTWRLYLDGRLETKLQTGGEAPEDASIQHAGLGTAFNSSGVADGSFAGDLDEIRIWNVARTGAEIRAGKNSETTGTPGGLRGRWGLDEGAGASAVDSSGHGVTGSISGASPGFPATASLRTRWRRRRPRVSTLRPATRQIALTWTADGQPDVAGYNLYRSSTRRRLDVRDTRQRSRPCHRHRLYDSDCQRAKYFYAVVAVDGSNNASDASIEEAPSRCRATRSWWAQETSRTAREARTRPPRTSSWIPGPVWTAGDNVYQNGLLSEFNNCYEPTWGAFKARGRGRRRAITTTATARTPGRLLRLLQRRGQLHRPCGRPRQGLLQLRHRGQLACRRAEQRVLLSTRSAARRR